MPILDLFGISRIQTVFGAERPMRPHCGLFGRAKVLEFAHKLVSQNG